MSSRVDVQQRLVAGDIAEGAHKRHFESDASNGKAHILTVLVTEFQEIVAVDVGHQVTVGPVGGDHFSVQAALVQFYRRQVQADQFVGRHFGANLGPVVTAGKMRADR